MNLERIELESGNGTRYDLLFGQEGNRVFLAWLGDGGSRGSCLYATGPVEATHLMKKMDLRNHADANALLGFLASRGHPAFVSAGYDENGVWI